MTRFKTTIVSLFMMIMIITTSCASWKKRQSYQSPVWSDTNDEIAYLHTYYEFKSHWPAGGDIRNQTWEISLLDTLLNLKGSITERMKGNPLTLYYMKSAGYFVAGNYNGGKFHILDLSGDLIKELKPEDKSICKSKLGNFQSIEALPSLDGSLIAFIQTRSNCTLEISFLDVNTNFTPKATYTYDAPDFDELAWTRSGKLVIATCKEYCGDKFLLIVPVSGIETLNQNYGTLYPCFYTKTASSFINKHGMAVVEKDEKREFMILDVNNLDTDSYYFSSLLLTPDAYLPGCALFDD